MRTPAPVIVAAFAFFAGASFAVGARAADVVVPEPLKPWVPWVLHGNEERRCPLVDVDVHRCQWPGPLQITVSARGGTFEQRWSVMKEEHVTLPGGDERWPQEVTVDGKKAVVVGADGLPTVTLAPGEHVVRGVFLWDEQPESLAIPEETALFTLTVAGRSVLFPRREGADVYFDKDDEEAEEREEDSLDVAIFRKIVDDAPVTIETRMVLDVAGKAREITVPNALLPGFEAARVAGPVPVRIEGTSLRAQVRPGSHTVVIIGRSVRQTVALAGPPLRTVDDEAGGDAAGPAEEIWVYEARPSLRIAHVEGSPSIAADQTRLPGDWRSLPAYRVLPGESWKLVEDRRGDADPPPSQLSLARTLWLDFDGRGATVRDLLSGSFNGDRLEMAPGTKLGHVSVGGKDAFITALASSGGPALPGVEVRQRSLNVMAESRIEGGLSSFPAVSWAHDFQGASIDLQLPPGWKLVTASGVDEVSDTWLKRWTLFEIFLVVVLVAAILRLWGPLLAVVAGAAFVLTFQEADAPIASWVVVVVLAGLHRALPESTQTHWAVRLLAITRVVTAIIVALITLSFAVGQVRVGMYPALAQDWRKVGDGAPGQQLDQGGTGNVEQDMAWAANAAPPPPPPPPEAEPQQVQGNDRDDGDPMADKPEPTKNRRERKSDLALLGAIGSGSGGGGYGSGSGLIGGLASVASEGEAEGGRVYKKARPSKQMTVVDPDAVVQTGPGLPRWGWESVTMSFSGPVQQGQTIELLLLSPSTNLLLAFLRVALLAVLVVCAFGFPGNRWPQALLRRFRGRGAVWMAGLMVALSSLSAAPASAQGSAQVVPDVDTLDELRERLLAPPSCGDSCVQIARVRIEATSSSLRLVFEVHAETAFSVPLPADDGQFTPRSILVDGKPGNAVRQDDRVLVRVGKGVHDIVVEGPLPARDTVQLALPLTPRRGTFTSSTWTLDGIHEDGIVDQNLQLSRIEKDNGPGDGDGDGAKDSAGANRGDLPPSVLPPFLRVDRTVMLGLTFEVETRVVRLSPMGTPIVVDVPLLPGESVTTDGVRAEQKDGKGVAKISLGPNDSEVSWHSQLAQQPALTLLAPTGVPWLESWQVQESPLWHVTRTGIPPIHGQPAGVDGVDSTGNGSSWFRPWPGEKVELALLRPAGVPGQTITIDEVKLNVRPGLRSTGATLSIELRASRGGQHPVKLPPGTELLSASINGVDTPLRPQSDVVTVPLNPGSQRIELQLRMPQGVAFHTQSPVVDVGQEAVNAEVTLELPSDRWVLFCWGPRTGPAVLFWSFLVVIVMAAAALSRVPVSTLKLHHWVLLSLGLTQVPVAVAALVAGWLLVLGWRTRPLWTVRGRVPDVVFGFFQLLLIGWTIAAIVGLGVSIHEGLVGNPDMQIAGNGSSGTSLRWYADRTTSTLPLASAWSVPLLAYRVAMLAWSFWLALALLRWLKEGFRAFGAGGYYREPWHTPPKRKPGSPASGSPGPVRLPEAPAGAPTSAAPMSAAPMSTAPTSAAPMSTAPMSTAPMSTGASPQASTGAPAGLSGLETEVSHRLAIGEEDIVAATTSPPTPSTSPALTTPANSPPAPFAVTAPCGSDDPDRKS